MENITKIDLRTYVDAVLEAGESINSAANRAGVNASTLRRLVIADTRYAQAKAAGKLVSRDVSTAEQLRLSPLAMRIKSGELTVAEAANEYGISDFTVRNRMKKAYPNFLPAYSKNGVGQIENEHNPLRIASPSQGPAATGSCPLISWDTARAHGDSVAFITNELVETYMAAPRAHSQNSYVLRIESNGMTALVGAPRTFPIGCLIFVDGGVRNAQEGDRVIARLADTGNLTFRIYHEGEGKPWLEPLNAMFEPTRGNFTVVGKVFGKWEDA